MKKEEYKVCVYAICKNEEKFVERWMDSVSEADSVIVTDTGSTDKTVEMLKNRGATVFETKVEPWRFDDARNISLGHVPDDADICVCIDLDEVFNKGWRRSVEAAWNENITRLRYKYIWNFKEDGTPGITFMLDNIHTRQGYTWKHPVHEVLTYCGDDTEKYGNDYLTVLNHHADVTKSRAQYLPLLELSVEEDPADDRNMHYLGREYMYKGMWDKSIATLEKHLSLPKAVWEPERCASMRFIARCWREKGDYAKASKWLYRAIAECPEVREPYVEMAFLAYSQKNWAAVFHMVEEALKIKERPNVYINEAFCWDETVYDLGAVSCYNLGIMDKALEYAEIAYEMNEKDERLKNNYNIIFNKIHGKKEEL